MAFFNEWSNIKIEKLTTVTYYGTKYTTPKGFAMKLGDQVASQILEKHHKNVAKYGAPYLRKDNEAGLKKWREHRKRIRAKFIRRATPLLEKLWAAPIPAAPPKSPKKAAVKKVKSAPTKLLPEIPLYQPGGECYGEYMERECIQ